jgi:hypothetical protein
MTPIVYAETALLMTMPAAKHATLCVPNPSSNVTPRRFSAVVPSDATLGTAIIESFSVIVG